MAHYAPASRPLSVAIPHTFGAQGPYCPRRPHLSEILANTSTPPWTLSAFMAYLSQNHCLETLEFTMDATRYRKHYLKTAGRCPNGQIAPKTEECVYIQSLWQRLLQAYIIPNGPREVNLPSDVRNDLLSLSADTDLPPHPSVLDTAVQKVYELMEESVLVPFLNSVWPQSSNPDSAYNTSSEELSSGPHAGSYDDRAFYRARSRRQRRSSPPLSMSTPATGISTNRASAPSSFASFARTLSHSARQISHPNSHTSSATNSTRTSASAATLSPLFAGGSPMSVTSGSVGDRREREQSGSAWRKMRSSFGFRKKADSPFGRDDEMQM
ncbi:regulator of G protein signaling superfamily [Trichodelitschia bisporula]|uniref:Regulator of G protein signaling superfamily n=1 Tax=Trichodelitschia bisporula TaxID=703511 RepID=A0A6G1HU16_9PEZI|nr:regulator of G protein signaling superfamily [Trichodelitschia bisporula]